MSWPFLAVLFSGWLYVDAAYRGPEWQRWLFRPITLILLLLWGCNADFLTSQGYLILAGLAVSLLADMMRMLSSERLLASVALMFTSYLLYTISFGMQLDFSLYLPWLPIPLVIAAITLVLIWTKLEDMQAMVFALLIMSMIMAWVAGDQFFGLGRDYNFSIMVGAFLLFISNCIWLIARFRFSFKASKAIVAALYFLGQFFIIRAIYL
ncbi:lysoplasmalogenase [Providencia manganoxydans]|uniref:lysoplasmalogenase n=1 Tax=Providencia manganoxydans TaxID=2923283 RepID=UPI0034E47F70